MRYRPTPPETKARIIAAYEQNTPARALAERFGLTRQAIHKIIRESKNDSVQKN